MGGILWHSGELSFRTHRVADWNLAEIEFYYYNILYNNIYYTNIFFLDFFSIREIFCKLNHFVNVNWLRGIITKVGSVDQKPFVQLTMFFNDLDQIFLHILLITTNKSKILFEVMYKILLSNTPLSYFEVSIKNSLMTIFPKSNQLNWK